MYDEECVVKARELGRPDLVTIRQVQVRKATGAGAGQGFWAWQKVAWLSGGTALAVGGRLRASGARRLCG